MGETGEKQSDITLPFKLRNPDGSYQQISDPVKQTSIDQIVMLNPDEVKFWKNMGMTPEPVNPTPKPTFIEMSQTTHDKEN
ncbi:MAG TPA: hypothetical protein PLI45_02880 [Candidatus Woesebacteria bacterium]|nr:hypothetical protein [Candidatus Woesebacteria bacterium]